MSQGDFTHLHINVLVRWRANVDCMIFVSSRPVAIPRSYSCILWLSSCCLVSIAWIDQGSRSPSRRCRLITSFVLYLRGNFDIFVVMKPAVCWARSSIFCCINMLEFRSFSVKQLKLNILLRVATINARFTGAFIFFAIYYFRDFPTEFRGTLVCHQRFAGVPPGFASVPPEIRRCAARICKCANRDSQVRREKFLNWRRLLVPKTSCHSSYHEKFNWKFST